LTTAVPQPTEIPTLIFKNVLGPSGGGGGGGNRRIEPERLKTENIPAIKPPEPQPQLIAVEEPVPPQFTPPAAMVSAIPTDVPLAMMAPGPPSPGAALGAGNNGAGGPGDGGVGTGTKDGLGPGDGPNTGDGPYGPGDVDVQVVPIYTPRPGYSAAGLERKIQGEVALSCIVLATGRVGTCRVTRSLDSNTFGMDAEALKAAAKFVFRPATRKGQPVPVNVNIVIAFTLR
jgi:protein TonB